MGRALPSYRRHPNGSAFYEYQGKRTYLGPYDEPRSRQRYARVVAQIAAGGPGAVAVRSDIPTIAELILEYLDYATSYYAANKEFKGMTAALKHLYNFAGDIDGREFGSAKLMDFQQYMLTLTYQRKRGKELVSRPYSRSQINKQVGRIKRFIRWCSQRELVPSEQYSKLICVEPLSKGRCRAPEAPDVEPVAREIVEQTLPYLTQTASAMVRVQMLCGMRPQDVCGMRWEDITTEGTIWIYRVLAHKNSWRGQELHKAIPRAVQAILQPFAGSGFVFSPIRSEELRLAGLRKRRRPTKRRDRKRPLRDRYDTDSYRRAIDYGIKKAARAGIVIPHWHPNQLRHTIATEIRQAIGEEASQVWLGHASIDTTGIYTKKQISELVSVAQELDRLWASQSAPAQLPPSHSSPSNGAKTRPQQRGKAPGPALATFPARQPRKAASGRDPRQSVAAEGIARPA